MIPSGVETSDGVARNRMFVCNRKLVDDSARFIGSALQHLTCSIFGGLVHRRHYSRKKSVPRRNNLR